MRKTLLLFVFVFGLSLMALSQQNAKVVNAYAQNESIIIEYDLDADADFVMLFVSVDGGATWRGPMSKVSGDTRAVAAGNNHRILWAVLEEYGSDLFESDQVRFKLNIQLREKWRKETFVTANVAYSIATQYSMGFSVGQVKHFGWFISVMSNGSLSGFNYDGECDGQGFVEGGYLPYYTGEVSKMRLSLMGGVMMRVIDPLCVRVGLGYGNRTLRWQTEDGRWLRNTPYSDAGLDLSAGMQLHLNSFVLSAEVVTTQFQTMEAKIGFGYAF
ncbi:MAG: hypothetical protein K6A28_06100 [Bacteroidales bacterium]|nr:hypothetical protein [Bacteroidales bacterium]